MHWLVIFVKARIGHDSTLRNTNQWLVAVETIQTISQHSGGIRQNCQDLVVGFGVAGVASWLTSALTTTVATILARALLASCLFSAAAVAQTLTLPKDIKRNADDVLALMAFAAVPDLTTSFLSIDDAKVGENRLSMTQFAGGETISKDYPVYLEGSVAFMRFDPTFVATFGQEQRELPARWNSVALTGGVGWDFEITPNLVLRPIVNVSLGHVESDLSLIGRLAELNRSASLDFLDDGRLNAYGLGGSLMLDYTLVKPAYEIDVELRYTNIQLKTFDSSAVVSGSATAQAVSLYSRYRAPTGLTVMNRPLRYVLELASTTYVGDQRGLLGFNYLSSVGAGIEFDSTDKFSWLSRTRIIARYAFGENIRGFAIGLAVTF